MAKILCIGFGSSGRRYLKNLKRINNFEIFVARRNLDFKINPPLEQYENYNFINFEEIAKYAPYKFGFINTPSALHFQNLKMVDKYIEESLLIEKPLITDMKDKEDLKNICRASSFNIFIGYQYRFHPITKYIKNIIDNKKFGYFVEGEFNHAEDVRNWHPWEDYQRSYSVNSNLGGGVKNTLSHDIDTAIYLFGKPAKKINFFGKASHESELLSDANDWHKCIFYYNFESKIKPIQINASYNSRIDIHNFVLHFQNASILGDYNKGLIEVYEEGGNLIKKKEIYASKDDCFYDLLKNMTSFPKRQFQEDVVNLINEDYIELICDILLE